MAKFTRILAALLLSASAAAPALADDDDDDGRKHWRKHRHSYYDGACKYEYKAGPHGYKEEVKCKPVRFAAGPPPWAYQRHDHYRPLPIPAWQPPFDLGLGRCNRDLLGGVIGGAVGGLAGSQIGKGSGKLVATGAGTLIGVLVGGAVGRSMDRVDQSCVAQVLEYAPTQRAVAWVNPDLGAQYDVLPTRTFQDRAGRYCREFQTRASVGGQPQLLWGTACRQPDGSWELVG